MKTYDLELKGDKTVTASNEFSSKDFAEVYSQAPELAEQATSILRDPDANPHDHVNLTLSVKPDDLETLYNFVAKIIVAVDGYEDGDGDEIPWKRLDKQERVEFLDRKVSAGTVIALYRNAYLIQTGLSELNPDMDDGDERGDSDDVGEKVDADNDDSLN